MSRPQQTEQHHKFFGGVSRWPWRCGKRPVPFRTRKLSPPAPMVLHPRECGRVGHRRTHHQNHLRNSAPATGPFSFNPRKQTADLAMGPRRGMVVVAVDRWFYAGNQVNPAQVTREELGCPRSVCRSLCAAGIFVSQAVYGPTEEVGRRPMARPDKAAKVERRSGRLSRPHRPPC